jgi:hypothetical protein
VGFEERLTAFFYEKARSGELWGFGERLNCEWREWWEWREWCAGCLFITWRYLIQNVINNLI